MTAPFLIRVLPNVSGYQHRDLCYRTFVLVFTFFCYTSYHLSRKPISVVKSVLYHKNCSDVAHGNSTNTSDPYWCDWPPFDKSDASSLLGTLDLCYLIAYAVAMFLSGHLADRMNLRHYLSIGMIGSGIFTMAFGFGYFFNIHSFIFYACVQVVGGAFQATGWPSVVACVGNWFGKGKRGLIMGIWNAHTSVGNILGSVIAGAFVDIAWGWSFVVPGIIISFIGILVFFFMVPNPRDVDCAKPDHSDTLEQDPQEQLDVDQSSVQHKESETKVQIVSRCIDTEADTEEERMVRAGETTALLPSRRHVPHKEKAISIWKAFMIPGVLEFSLCLFFAKLVSYTFLYWLPNYISVSETSLSASQSAYTSTMFDVGGIVGGILAGYISDRFRLRGLTCVIFLIAAAPLLFVYQAYGSKVPYYANCLLLVVCGACVNGPYSLITTAVSADLGTHKSVRESAKALGMVTAIIDGTGSIGAALGPMLTGVISNSGWQNVFYMLIAADFVAALLLSRVVVKEIRQKIYGYEDDVTIIVPKNTVQGDVESPKPSISQSQQK
ncbi:glucose-6-phosphate exchanger SLC37A2 [Aplysia californica]|uniref:Sugar phosphate exchanger 3 n=1 Tax=Aplysia californica TaxID=6500 RepID=A0ABM0ZVE5_APLCA|nr:glucose-6-phosphate exchanger SLC37A2 [Aplysia californica]